MSMKGYDEKCGDLARYFLPEGTIAEGAALAQHIQDAVEDWLSGREAVPIVEAPPQTPAEAAAFFSRYGNVGAPADLLRTSPTEAELAAACDVALSRGQSQAAVDAARRLILDAQREVSI